MDKIKFFAWQYHDGVSIMEDEDVPNWVRVAYKFGVIYHGCGNSCCSCDSLVCNCDGGISIKRFSTDEPVHVKDGDYIYTTPDFNEEPAIYLCKSCSPDLLCCMGKHIKDDVWEIDTSNLGENLMKILFFAFSEGASPEK